MASAALATILAVGVGAPKGGDSYEYTGSGGNVCGWSGVLRLATLGRMAEELRVAQREVEFQPVASPVPVAPGPEPTAVAQLVDPVQEFLAGYRACGGVSGYEEHLVDVVIPCETGWDVDPGGHHLGLAQFDPTTWEQAAPPQSDYRNPWAQGCAVANWLNGGIDPGSTAGWPYCWWAGVGLPVTGGQ